MGSIPLSSLVHWSSWQENPTGVEGQNPSFMLAQLDVKGDVKMVHLSSENVLRAMVGISGASVPDVCSEAPGGHV